jgi:hypothetical protein
LNALTKEWSDKAVSYLMLTNAGGAVAVLSFMGASDKVRRMAGPRFALGCFASGVICMGILVAKQLHRFEGIFKGCIRDSTRYLSDQIEWDTLTSDDAAGVKPSFLDYFLGYCAFALFIMVAWQV